MATYSLAITGQRADAVTNPVANVKLSDADAGQVGSQQQAMQNGTPFLCKNPDGSQSYYMLDTQRSIPGVVKVLIPM